MSEAKAESISARYFYMRNCSISTENFGKMIFCDVSRELRDLNSHRILQNFISGRFLIDKLLLEKDFFAFEEQIWIDCVLDLAYALEIVFLDLEIVFGGRASEIFFAEKVIFVDEQGFFFAG